MKMRLFIRFLLTIYVLIVLFVIGVTLLCVWGLIDKIHPQYWIETLYGSNTVFWSVTLGGIAVVLLSVTILFSGFKKRKPKTAKIRNTESGAISISILALEEMATRYLAADTAIRSVKAFVASRDGKLTIKAVLSVAEGTNIPDVLGALQDGLKANIELLAGIEVCRIKLLVEKTAQVIKARVE
ncbi:MAG: alkaline shock response membrane anchor protein AmaP [Christensenellales bacterium]